jgi:hypothetical protein
VAATVDSLFSIRSGFVNAGKAQGQESADHGRPAVERARHPRHGSASGGGIRPLRLSGRTEVTFGIMYAR